MALPDPPWPLTHPLCCAVNNAGGAPSYTASPQSNVWPATTVGRPGAPTISSVVGSELTITVTLKQAADVTAIAFELKAFDTGSSPTEISGYSAPLLSVGPPDGSGWQKVVFGTHQDPSRLGGSYKFKVGGTVNFVALRALSQPPLAAGTLGLGVHAARLLAAENLNCI